MAGLLIPVLPKRRYDFSTLSVGGALRIVIADRIDISRHIEATLAVRVASAAISASNTVYFALYGCGYTPNDPTLDFRTSAPFPFLGETITRIGRLTTFGGAIRGQYADLVLLAIHGSAGPFNITLSADLVLRSPDEVE